MTGTCETCLFWNGRADTVNKTVTLMSGKKDLRQITYSRECRRFPVPRPQMPYHEWCGEYQAKVSPTPPAQLANIGDVK